MNPKNFLAGLEEAVSRIVSLLITTTFFAIYTIARGDMHVDWRGLVQLLVLFWLVYELLSYLLFIILKYFSDRQPPEAGVGVPIDENILKPENLPKGAETAGTKNS